MLTERQRLTRQTVRAFAQCELAPGATARDREAAFPKDAFDKMAALGLFGMMVPEEFGGAGADYVAYYFALMEVAAADGGVSTALQVHDSLVCGPILKFGNAAQKQRFLEPLAAGRALGVFCVTEPDAGSDAAAIRTRARRAGNQFVLDGVKQFITCGKSADIALVFALTDPGAGKRGISAFLVPTATLGYRVGRAERTMGHRAIDQCQIVLEDCRVPPEGWADRPPDGARSPRHGAEPGRDDIVPTYAMFMDTSRQVAHACWHWYFLAQAEPFPERLIGNDPDFFFETCLVGWGATKLADFDPEMLAEYRRGWRDSGMIHSACADYRAAATVDLEHDAGDIGRRVGCPTLAFYGANGAMARLFDILAEWRKRCTDVAAASLPGGHFFVDQFPRETVDILTGFLSRIA
jgi:acyl-CoA dehydrogenase-like protein